MRRSLRGRVADEAKETTEWLDKTDELIKRSEAL